MSDVMETEQLPLFGAPQPVAVRSPKRVAIDGVGPVRWQSFKAVNRRQCDHCVLAEHERHNVLAPVDIRSARFRRTRGDAELLLCAAHAEQLKADDFGKNLISARVAGVSS